MEVMVDGKPYAEELAGANLQEVLNDLMSRALGDEHTLAEVRVNGRPYQEAELGPAESVPREAIQRLEVETIPARELALHFLSHADDYLGPIMAAVSKVAELFRVSDEVEASEAYLGTLESLQLFLQVLGSSRQVLGLDFAAVSHEGVSAAERLERLSALVGELLAAQEQEDWVLLADILQYDLNQELAAWQRLIPLIREQALC